MPPFFFSLFLMIFLESIDCRLVSCSNQIAESNYNHSSGRKYSFIGTFGTGVEKLVYSIGPHLLQTFIINLSLSHSFPYRACVCAQCVKKELCLSCCSFLRQVDPSFSLFKNNFFCRAMLMSPVSKARRFTTNEPDKIQIESKKHNSFGTDANLLVAPYFDALDNFNRRLSK